MAYLKHDEVNGKKSKKKMRLTPADTPENTMPNFQCVADAIEGFASIFSTWVTQERNGDNGSGLFTDSRGYPVKVSLTSLDGEDEALHSVEIELTGTAVHSIADSLKRIADALSSGK
jgi:hypothetical protein